LDGAFEASRKTIAFVCEGCGGLFVKVVAADVLDGLNYVFERVVAFALLRDDKLEPVTGLSVKLVHTDI